jgi:hypothetical protein
MGFEFSPYKNDKKKACDFFFCAIFHPDGVTMTLTTLAFCFGLEE